MNIFYFWNNRVANAVGMDAEWTNLITSTQLDFFIISKMICKLSSLSVTLLLLLQLCHALNSGKAKFLFSFHIVSRRCNFSFSRMTAPSLETG